MARKAGPIGPIEDGVPVPKRGSAGGHGKHAKSNRPKIKEDIQSKYIKLLETGRLDKKSREAFVTDMEEKYNYKVDIKAVRRYMDEIDISRNT